ncbi:glycosyltransferase family 4 protein [Enterococcus faecalis]|uniref:glycosyltransferase family 4 protein n=1 Tax=Enterococcus faecalis TaxID=1351 RepID=UPI0022E0628F|nr:glycosyltransferase family 4 protein [Enterococcus faecalis]
MILVISNMYPSKKYPNYGVFVKNFCENLSKEETVKIVSITKTQSYLKKIYYYITYYFKIMYHYAFKKYDLIYVHYAGYNAPAILMARLFNRKTKLIVNVHGSDVIPEKALESYVNRFTKKLVRVADVTVVPSDYFEEIVKKKYGTSVNTWVSPSAGVNLSLFNPSKKIIAKNEELTLGFVSRIDKQKGWDLLINAVEQLSREGMNLKLVMVGSGKEDEEAKKLIERLGVSHLISKFSMLDQKELVSIYSTIDVFIFPSEREGESLGLVGLEAMACGTPVIGSNLAGIKTYVQDSYNGYLFDPGDINHLKECIKKYENLSLEERQKFSYGALATAQKYDSIQVNNQLVDKIKRVLTL